MRRAACALLGLVAAACHDVEPLPAPDLAGAAMVLMLYRQDGALVRAAVVEPDQGLPPLSRETSRTVEVVAAGYPCPRGVYGLRAGEQTLLNMPNASGTIPAPMRASALGVTTDSANGGWTAVEPRGPSMNDVLTRLAMSADLCPQVVVERLDFDPDPSGNRLEDVDVESTTALGGGRALVVTSTTRVRGGGPDAELRRAFVIDDRGVTTPVDIVIRGTGTSSLPRGLFAGDSRGRVWHIARNGKVSRGTIEGGLDFLVDVDLGPYDMTEALVADSAITGEPAMFVAAVDGDLRGVVLEVGGQHNPVVRSVGASYPRLGAVSGDELFVGSLGLFEPAITRVVRDASGTWVTGRAPLPELPMGLEDGWVETTASVSVDPRGRVVLTQSFLDPPFYTRNGSSWFEQQGGTWQRADGVDLGFAALDSVALGDGVIAVAGTREDDSTVVFRQRNAGICHHIDYTRTRGRGNEGPAMVPLDHDTLLIIPEHTRSQAQIARVVSRPPACLDGP